jgi:anti-sigma B factor antagonist
MEAGPRTAGRATATRSAACPLDDPAFRISACSDAPPDAVLLRFASRRATLSLVHTRGSFHPMTSAASRLRVNETDGITRIEFVDRNILDEANIQQIGDEITQIIDAQPQPKILISFNNVDHLSSAALGTLITLNNKIRAKDGQLRLANIDQQIYEVFVITKLNKLFQIHESTDQALESFR